MKRLILLLVAAVVLLGATPNTRLAYIEQYAPLAVSEMQRTGVPASITLAQALVESGAGSSPLARHANNHFGIKCHNDWTGEKYYKDDDLVHECFRAFPSAEDSFRAHSDFLRDRAHYRSLFELDPTDYKGWAHGLKQAGYATDPHYAGKLIKVIEDYELYRYDALAIAGEPDAEQEPAPEPEPEPEEKLDPVTPPAGYSESVVIKMDN